MALSSGIFIANGRVLIESGPTNATSLQKLAYLHYSLDLRAARRSRSAWRICDGRRSLAVPREELEKHGVKDAKKIPAVWYD